jgi:transglutaminase-like putative cysteine protease
MVRTALLGGLAAGLLVWGWARLEIEPATSELLPWAILVGVLPAIPRRHKLRFAAAVAAALLGIHEALGTIAPDDALARFRDGFLRYYDIALPFNARFQPLMHGLVVLAVLGFVLATSLAVAARKPLLAAGLLIAGAGWPMTLQPGEHPLLEGAALLGAALVVVACASPRLRAPQAAFAGAAVVAAAVGIATMPAVAKGAFLGWEKWDPYTRPDTPVSVKYVWDTTYLPLTWPKKKTVVFRVKAPPLSRYWRAVTLDVYHGESWIPYPHPTDLAPQRFVPLMPPAARNPKNQLRARFEIEALQDEHLLAASIPVAYETDFDAVLYQSTGTATVPEGIPRGSKYTSISYVTRPSPSRLLRSRPIYNVFHEPYRSVQARWRTPLPPPFGTPNRDGRMATFFRTESLMRSYRPLYEQARRVAGATASPYLAAVRLENWFRSGGGFSYDENPPRRDGRPILVQFVTDSRSGYCQYFAGAMALMLRYLGIPARVAAGFTSGRYNPAEREWTVTDHDAHTWVEVWFRGFGWLPFDPTPGRGTLDGAYSAASSRFDITAVGALFGLDAADQKLNGSGLDRVPGLLDSGRDVPGDVGGTTQAQPSLLRLVALLGLTLLAALTLAKQALRRARFLTRDARRTAAACRRELADFLADQRIAVPASATLAELGALARDEVGVNAEPFVSAAEAARYGPPARADVSARAARRELRRLQREIRQRLTRVERARGLVSLRSLGVT